jgi:hypothetical protein
MKRPANLSDLQRRIDRYRRDAQLAPDRLHQRISSELLFGVLSEATAKNVIPMFLLKGGMAMELRFGLLARASGDVDIGIVSPSGDLVSALDRALSVGFAGFTFVRKGAPQHLEQAATHRVEIQISYRGKVFSVLRVDLNEASFETAADVVTTGVLTALGLPGPVDVPILEPYLQAAHKLHGATEPSRPDYVNNRYRDLIDILIFAQNTPDISFPRLRRIALAEFARRKTHTNWPPIFRIPDTWLQGLQAEAEALHFSQTDPGELEYEFLRFIANIEGVDVKEHFEYRFVSLQLQLIGGQALAAEAEAELRQLEDDGWRMIYQTYPRPGYNDQMLAVFERPRLSGRAAPRLQLRMQSRKIPGQRLTLTGDLFNISEAPANKVRVFMVGAEPVVRLGTITNRDGGLTVKYCL